jgi:hypothetical protein
MHVAFSFLPIIFLLLLLKKMYGLFLYSTFSVTCLCVCVVRLNSKVYHVVLNAIYGVVRCDN